MTRHDIEKFFTTLILGDFEEDQNTAAMIVGGLISLIPILDQVLDARDITGTLFRINKQGGFKSAMPDQLVNLGFAAFGAVPEVGSAFKTIFKPMWRERRAAKGLVHGGMEAVEGLLHLQKGGAITWVRKELIGKWGPRTNQAIIATESAMDGAIELLDFIATASGWKSWLIPASVQALAKELLPGLKTMRGEIRAPLERASKEIREFLEDLLGEQAASVIMAVGEQAVIASAVAGTRTKAGHNAADLHPKGKVPAREPEHKVAERPQADKKKGAGPVHTAIARTRKAFSDLASQEKGLVGEHITDYHELKRLGGNWPHDKLKGTWQPVTVQKINCDKRPVNLSLVDLPKVNHPGIDAVWQHSSQYTVTEAKARESIAAAYGLGKYLASKGIIPKVIGLNPSEELLHYLLSDSGDKRGTIMATMQMSLEWVKDRATKEDLNREAKTAIKNDQCSRRVILVTFESEGALDHVQALADIHLGKAESDVYPHPVHGITKEWEAAAIDTIEKARVKAHEIKQQTTQAVNESPGKSKNKKGKP